MAVAVHRLSGSKFASTVALDTPHYTTDTGFTIPATLTDVPEPGSAALVLAGVICALFVKRSGGPGILLRFVQSAWHMWGQ